MKKIIYIAILAFVSSMAITSCTEEAVTPKTQANTGGGAAMGDPVK